MPTYSYLCTACDNAFDIHQPFTADSLTVCPVCGGQLRKVFSPVGVTFSGSGFYRTDSRPARPSESGSSDAGSSSTTAADKPAAAAKETAAKSAPVKSGATGGASSSSSSSASSGASTGASTS